MLNTDRDGRSSVSTGRMQRCSRWDWSVILAYLRSKTQIHTSLQGEKKKVGENVVFDTFLLSFTHFNIIFINFVFPIVRLNKVTAGTRPFVETGFSIRYILEIIIHNVYLPL